MPRNLACARPACGLPAAAWLTYEYATRRVWLDDEPGGGDQWGLCSEHAGRLTVPRGWVAVDRRVGRRGRPAPPASLAS